MFNSMFRLPLLRHGASPGPCVYAHEHLIANRMWGNQPLGSTNHLLYTSGDWNLNTRPIIINCSTPPSPPPWWLLPRGMIPPPLLSLLGPSPLSSRGCYSRSWLTCPWSLVLPITLHFLRTWLRICTVGIPFTLFTVSFEPSKPFVMYLSASITWSSWGTIRLVTSRPRLDFAFGNASAAVTLVDRLQCLD